MTISERTTYFNVIVGLFNIVLGLIIEFGLIALCYLALARMPETANSIPVSVLLPFVLLIGLVLAMVISVKCITWTIKKFNLQDKLDQKVVKRYIKDSV
ncbi:MAG TPA: hypothetical protein DCF70_05965 [Treponema sp.]|nr:hypothetical protein [Treponema sp.]